jgi:hypothetical protein
MPDSGVNCFICAVQEYLAHKKNTFPLGLCSRTMSRALLGTEWRVRFLMSEVPLYSLGSGKCVVRKVPLGPP